MQQRDSDDEVDKTEATAALLLYFGTADIHGLSR